MRKIVLACLLAPIVISGCATHDPGQVRIEERSEADSKPSQPTYSTPAPGVDRSVERNSGQNSSQPPSAARAYPGDSAGNTQAPVTQPSQSQPPQPQPPEPVFREAPATTAAPSQPAGALLALLEQAEDQHQAGNNQRALSSLERAQRIAPREPLVYLQLARLRLDMKDYQRADQLARKGLSLSSGNPQMQDAFKSLLSRIKRRKG